MKKRKEKSEQKEDEKKRNKAETLTFRNLFIQI